jgi:hypothetical protein
MRQSVMKRAREARQTYIITVSLMSVRRRTLVGFWAETCGGVIAELASVLQETQTESELELRGAPPARVS